MIFGLKFESREEEKPVEEIVTDFAKFVKTREAKEFTEKWSKKKKYKKVGITELLFIVWNSQGTKGNKAVLRKANEILEKLGGEGEWFSFLSGLKLMPERMK
ncbi:MAG: hypothetical protein WC488_03775 [Candidatus Micrarchaeia archaeon]